MVLRLRRPTRVCRRSQRIKRRRILYCIVYNLINYLREHVVLCCVVLDEEVNDPLVECSGCLYSEEQILAKLISMVEMPYIITLLDTYT